MYVANKAHQYFHNSVNGNKSVTTLLQSKDYFFRTIPKFSGNTSPLESKKFINLDDYRKFQKVLSQLAVSNVLHIYNPKYKPYEFPSVTSYNTSNVNHSVNSMLWKHLMNRAGIGHHSINTNINRALISGLGYGLTIEDVNQLEKQSKEKLSDYKNLPLFLRRNQDESAVLVANTLIGKGEDKVQPEDNIKNYSPVSTITLLMHLRIYLANLCFDKKSNFSGLDEGDFIKGMEFIDQEMARFLHENREKALSATKKDNLKKKLEINNTYNHLEQVVNEHKIGVRVAQVRDNYYHSIFKNYSKSKKDPTIKNIFHWIDSDHEKAKKDDFIKDYLSYIHMTGGTDHESTLMVGALLNPNNTKEDIEFLGKFTRVRGALAQLMNDMADFLPMSAYDFARSKTIGDQYSDLRNGVMTLPIYFLLLGIDKKDRPEIYKACSILKEYKTTELSGQAITPELKQKFSEAEYMINKHAGKTKALSHSNYILDAMCKKLENMVDEFYKKKLNNKALTDTEKYKITFQMNMLKQFLYDNFAYSRLMKNDILSNALNAPSVKSYISEKEEEYFKLLSEPINYQHPHKW